jgi:hypothetical protein
VIEEPPMNLFKDFKKMEALSAGSCTVGKFIKGTEIARNRSKRSKL